MYVSELRPREAVYLDLDRLEGICRELGCALGEAAINGAMEDLAVLLNQAFEAWRGSDFESLLLALDQIVGVADRLGMGALKRVAASAAELAYRREDAALAAVIARLTRVGEGSLLAIWDAQGISV